MESASPQGKRAASSELLSDRPSKRTTKFVRGLSRLQHSVIVLAMGFAVGTNGDDIAQAMGTSTCEIVSRGPKVVAKLTYPDRAAAAEIIEEWNGAIVDGNELLVWATDDVVERTPLTPFSQHADAKSPWQTAKQGVSTSFGVTSVLNQIPTPQTKTDVLFASTSATPVVNQPPTPAKSSFSDV